MNTNKSRPTAPDPLAKASVDEITMAYAMEPHCLTVRTLKEWCKRYPKAGQRLTRLFVNMLQKHAEELRLNHEKKPSPPFPALPMTPTPTCPS